MTDGELEQIEPREGVGEDVTPAVSDAELIIDEDGLHLPDHLVGYVGSFTMRTPNVTGEMETSDHGLGETSDVLASVPEDGDYHADLSAGQMALSTPDHPEKVYTIADKRDNE